MAQYRIKPVLVEAFQLPSYGEDNNAFLAWAETVNLDYVSGRGGTIEIPTGQDVWTGEPGDWIVRVVLGSFAVIKPEVFAAIYEPA